MIDKGEVFAKLVHIARSQNMNILIVPELLSCYGRIKGNRIGLSGDMGIDDINYTLAHEIAHWYLHRGVNVMDSPRKEEYEQQADNTARLLLDALQVS